MPDARLSAYALARRVVAKASCRVVEMPRGPLASSRALSSAAMPIIITLKSNVSLSSSSVISPVGRRLDGLCPYRFANRSSSSGPCPAKKGFVFAHTCHLVAVLDHLTHHVVEVTA